MRTSKRDKTSAMHNEPQKRRRFISKYGAYSPTNIYIFLLLSFKFVYKHCSLEKREISQSDIVYIRDVKD